MGKSSKTREKKIGGTEPEIATSNSNKKKIKKIR